MQSPRIYRMLWIIQSKEKRKNASDGASCSIQLIIIRLNIFPSSLVKSKSLHWTSRGQKKRTQGSPPWPIRIQANHGQSSVTMQNDLSSKRGHSPLPLPSDYVNPQKRKWPLAQPLFFCIRSNFVKRVLRKEHLSKITSSCILDTNFDRRFQKPIFPNFPNLDQK